MGLIGECLGSPSVIIVTSSSSESVSIPAKSPWSDLGVAGDESSPPSSSCSISACRRFFRKGDAECPVSPERAGEENTSRSVSFADRNICGRWGEVVEPVGFIGDEKGVGVTEGMPPNLCVV